MSVTQGWEAKKWKPSEHKSLSSPLGSASFCCDFPKADCSPSGALKDQVLWSLVQFHGRENLRVGLAQSGVHLDQPAVSRGWGLHDLVAAGAHPVGGGSCFQKSAGPLLPRKGGCSHLLWNSVNWNLCLELFSVHCSSLCDIGDREVLLNKIPLWSGLHAGVGLGRKCLSGGFSPVQGSFVLSATFILRTA